MPVDRHENGHLGDARGYERIRADHQRMTSPLDYQRAQAPGPPIGSGEVESGYKQVLQKRLKIAGAWWLQRHAERMLQLRTVRANGDWNKYWTEGVKN